MIQFLVLFIIPCFAQIHLSGDIYVHDPSGIAQDSSNNYYIFATGQGIDIHYSSNLSVWSNGGHVWNNNYPSWWRALQPTGYGTVWAPDVLKYGNGFRLYYAISTFGSEVSCIGLATSSRLASGWSDQGQVICSKNGDGYNTIDPHVLIDTSGKHWMVFGSFWTGIKLVELNPSTGKTLNTQIYSIAVNPDANPDAIEASWIQSANGYYYLYVDWGDCCKGVQSTYQIRVGRSKSITGPYLDKSGMDMEKGGGTSLIPIKQGHIIGPGHVGIFESYLTYHYYDANNNGTPTLNLVNITYDSSQWPVLTN
jgi:arabinan endo-1,5-alpha-L-arabinosidase